MPSKKLFLASTILIVLITLPLIGSVGASSEMWSQTYGGKNMDVGRSLVETSDGGYAIAGHTTSYGVGSTDFWLVKTDGYGNEEWNQTYEGTSEEGAFSLVVTSDGGFAIAGYTTSFGAGSYDFWLAKTDEHGYIPEFPSWLILPLFLTVTLVVAIFRRKLSKTSNPAFILGS